MVKFDVVYDVICKKGYENTLANPDKLCPVVKESLVESWNTGTKFGRDNYGFFEESYWIRFTGEIDKSQLERLIRIESLSLLSLDTVIRTQYIEETKEKIQKPALVFIGEIGDSNLVLQVTPVFPHVNYEINLFRWNRIKNHFINWLESEFEKIHYIDEVKLEKVEDEITKLCNICYVYKPNCDCEDKEEVCKDCGGIGKHCVCTCELCETWKTDCSCVNENTISKYCNTCFFFLEDCICNDPAKAEEFGYCPTCIEPEDICVCAESQKCPDCKKVMSVCRCYELDNWSKEEYERRGICWRCDKKNELCDCTDLLITH